MAIDLAAMAPNTDFASTVRRGGHGTRGFSQDTNTFWQEVFDGARAVPQEQPSPPAASNARHTTGLSQPLEIDSTPQPPVPAVTGQPALGAAQSSAQTPVRLVPTGRAANNVLQTSPSAKALVTAERPAMASSSVPWTTMPDDQSESPPVPLATRLWQAARAADTATAPTESISVHMTADGIALRVRSPDLDAPEAIRYAREVARHLAGGAGQLRLLVLNGTTVYAAPAAEAPVDDPTPAGLLNIRC